MGGAQFLGVLTMKLIKPMAYVNFTTLDIAINFYLDKIPPGYEPVYTADYVESLIDDLNATMKQTLINLCDGVIRIPKATNTAN